MKSSRDIIVGCPNKNEVVRIYDECQIVKACRSWGCRTLKLTSTMNQNLPGLSFRISPKRSKCLFISRSRILLREINKSGDLSLDEERMTVIGLGVKKFMNAPVLLGTCHVIQILKYKPGSTIFSAFYQIRSFSADFEYEGGYLKI